MIKYYCDWCHEETSNPHGGVFGRRVLLPQPNHSTGNMNVCFTLEFSEPKPAHLCRRCYIRKVREAVDKLEISSLPLPDSAHADETAQESTPTGSPAQP